MKRETLSLSPEDDQWLHPGFPIGKNGELHSTSSLVQPRRAATYSDSGCSCVIIGCAIGEGEWEGSLVDISNL